MGTVQEELAALGIDNTHFETLYHPLVDGGKLPPVDEGVPWDAYKRVVEYLQGQHVLDAGCRVNPDGLEVFKYRRELEDIMRDLPTREHREVKQTGGLEPCTHPDYDIENTGGLMPCHGPDDEVSGGLMTCR